MKKLVFFLMLCLPTLSYSMSYDINKISIVTNNDTVSTIGGIRIDIYTECISVSLTDAVDINKYLF
jgi:hypothetical protein